MGKKGVFGRSPPPERNLFLKMACNHFEILWHFDETDWIWIQFVYLAQIIRNLVWHFHSATICLLGIQFNRVKNGHFWMLFHFVLRELFFFSSSPLFLSRLLARFRTFVTSCSIALVCNNIVHLILWRKLSALYAKWCKYFQIIIKMRTAGKIKSTLNYMLNAKCAILIRYVRFYGSKYNNNLFLSFFRQFLLRIYGGKKKINK